MTMLTLVSYHVTILLLVESDSVNHSFLLSRTQGFLTLPETLMDITRERIQSLPFKIKSVQNKFTNVMEKAISMAQTTSSNLKQSAMTGLHYRFVLENEFNRK